MMALPDDFSTLELTELMADEKTEAWQSILELCERAKQLHEKVSHEGQDLPRDHILRNHEIKLCYERLQVVRNELFLSSGVHCLKPDTLKQQLSRSTNSTERLHCNLKATGLKVHESISGDGNCFFRAISSQLRRLKQHDMGHADLRAQVVASLRKTTVILVDDGQLNLADFMSTSAAEYCDRMAQGGEWADHVAVIATANYLQKDIFIVTSSPDAGPENILTCISGNLAGFSGDPLLLGHLWEHHYQSLTPQDTMEGYGGTSPTQPSGHVHAQDEKVQLTTDPDAAFKAVIMNKFCRNHSKEGLHIEKLESNVSNEDYTNSYLERLDANGKGKFSSRHSVGETTQYYCERHGIPRGKKRGPHNTRCNSCSAYVSFKYVVLNDNRAVIIRSRLEHTGHDINDPRERHVSQLDPELVDFIQSLAKVQTATQILGECLTWARDNGHKDIHDRRYFPTMRDVQQVISAFKVSQRYHSDDSVSVSILCTVILKDKIVFYQPLDNSIDQPLIIVYQDDKQLHRMDVYGKEVVFLDATYKGITSYGYAFYALIAKTATGHGIPLFYIIASEDSAQTLRKALQKVKDHAEERGKTFAPMSFMVDKDIKEHKAIRAVFPWAYILLCWFHVLQAIYRWLNKHDSGVSGAANADTRRDVINYVRKMKNCITAEDFKTLSEQLDNVMPNAAVAEYLDQHWVPCGNMWANYGRRVFHGDHETNNLAERFFLGLKYHHLARHANKRVDELLLLLSVNVNPTYDYVEELAAIGRMPSKTSRKQKRTDDLVQSMLQQDWRAKTIWNPRLVCSMPSQQDPNDRYDVDLPHATCNCIAAAQQGLCKHYRLAKILAAERDWDPNQERIDRAEVLYRNGSFLQEDDSIEVYDEDIVGYVDVKTRRCVCVAYSHGIECICVKVAAMVCLPQTKLLREDPVTHNDLPAGAPDSTCDTANVQQQLQKISAAIEVQPLNVKIRKAAKHIDCAYKSMFGKHINTSKQHKIQPLPTGRKIAKKVKKKRAVDHNYGAQEGPVKKTKTLQDGGFRRTNRAKRTQRNPFTGDTAVSDSSGNEDELHQ